MDIKFTNAFLSMMLIAYQAYSVLRSVQSVVSSPAILVVGQRVSAVNEWTASSASATAGNRSLGEVDGSFDTVALWRKSFPTTSSVERKAFFGDCNINDAGPFTAGLTPEIPTFIINSVLCFSFIIHKEFK